MASVNKKKKKQKASKGAGAFSVFGAADTIKYRNYQNRMALEGGKNVPLSKEQWLKQGRPK